MALAVPLLAVALIVGIVAKLIAGERLLAARRNLHPGLRLELGRWRAVVLCVLAIILAASVILPLITLAVEAGQLERITTALGASDDAIFHSLSLATVGATLTSALAVFLGYARARSGARLRGLVDLLLIVIFAVPSTVVGVGLIGLWNRPGLLGAIYTSQAIVVVAYLARVLST